MTPTPFSPMKLGILLLGTALFAAPAQALVTTSRTAHTVAEYFETPVGGGAAVRTNILFGDTGVLPDGSAISHAGCVAREPGGIGCDFVPPLPNSQWWQRPTQPTTAAAQAKTTFGTNRARVHVSGGNCDGGCEETLPPIGTTGSRRYAAAGMSTWQDEWIYLGTAPTLVTLEFRVHASWDDRGRFIFNVGTPFFDGDGPNLIDYALTNCEAGETCGHRFDRGFTAGEVRRVIGSGPGDNNASGVVDELFRFDLWVFPFIDPHSGEEQPFDVLAQLEAFGDQPGADTDAFSTMRLERIFVDPGVSISFASGANFPLVVRGAAVPAPGTAVLMLAGLGVLAGSRRRAWRLALRPPTSSPAPNRRRRHH